MNIWSDIKSKSDNLKLCGTDKCNSDIGDSGGSAELIFASIFAVLLFIL